MAEEEIPVAETTEETDAPEASEETSAEEASTNEVVADEAVAEEATADEATADEATAEPANAPELNESLSQTATAPAATERVEVEGGRDYELIFIVRITESTDEASKRARAIIEESGGVVDNVRVSEQRRLAYIIKKEIEGFYVIINGRFTKEAAAELDRVLKLDEAILRHMTIRLDEE